MRYFIGFLIMIGLIFLLIFLLFGGGGKKAPTPKALDSYASTDAAAVLTIDAPTSSEGIHRQIRVSVDRDNVVYEQIKGYEGEVTLQKSFNNSENAFAAFLRSLQLAGYNQGNTDKAMADERGYCPLGDRYIFELDEGGDTIQRFWATNCGGPKSYLGNLDLTVELFQAQVPNYDELSQNIVL